MTATDLLSAAEIESRPEEPRGMASTHVGPHCHTVCSLPEGQVTPLALAAWDSSNVNVIKMLNSHKEYKETLLTTQPTREKFPWQWITCG